MSFSRAPILRFNDTKPSGNNVPTVKSQHTPRNEKKTTTTRTRPVVTTKKTSSYESGSTRSPSARSPWGLCAAGAQPTSLSLPTTPISQTSCSPAAVGVAVDSATVFAHSAMSPPAPAPGPAPAPARSARAASTGRSSAAPTSPRQPAPRAPGPAHAAPAPPAPASPRGRSAPPHPPPVAPIANADSADDAIDDIDDASVTSKEEKKTHSNASSETKSVKEDDGDNSVNTRIRSRSPSSRRSVDKRKTLLGQQYQDKRRKFVAARKELADKQKVVSSETVSTHQEGRHRHPDVTSRDPSSERDRSERDRSEGDNLDTEKEVHSSGKSTTDSEVWDKKCDEEEIDTVHWPDPEKTDVPTDAGSCMLKQLRDISNSYSGQVKELVRKRNHLLALVGGLIAMKRPVVCEELRKQFQECQKEADQLDLRMDDMRRKQTDSISSFGEAINSLAAEHERVKAELATALKVKSELESRGGSARLIARAMAEEKRLRAQAEKATAQLGALSAELQQERARGERVDAHAQLLAQELQQANVRLQELEGKLKEQTAIAHQMKEAVRLNQTQIHNMIIERCSMLREYTEVKNKADTEVNIIVREMETRLDLVNRRLQEEIEMSERLREQNWTFRNLLEESEARKRAVELFDRGVQTTGGGSGGGAKGAGHHDDTATRPSPGMGSASDSLVSDSEAVRSDGGDGPEDTPPSDEDDDDDEEEDNEDDDVTYENDGDCGGGEDDETPPGGPRGGAGGGARDGPDQRKAGEAEVAVPGGWPASAGASRSAPGSREERKRGRRRRSGSASDPSVKRGPRHTTAESSSDTEADSATLRAPEAEAEAEAEAETVAEAGAGPEEAVTVWERVPRPVPSGDTEVSFDLDDSGGGGGGGGAPSDSSSDCEHKRRERELKTEMESAHIALQMEKEFARALEEEMMKIQLQKATLEVESIKIADEKAILQHNMHKASVRERELREHFEKEFVRKLVRELIPKEQEIERLQVQVQELTKLANFNKQQFAEYERRMQELASGFEAPNAQGGVTSLREVVSDLHSHVESMRQSLQEVRGRNERLERALEAKGAEAAAQAQLALRRSRALQARDAQLQSLSAAMRQRDRHSSKIEKEVRRQTEQMSQLQALLQTRDSQLSRLTDMVEQMAIAPRPLALRTPPSSSSASATAPATPSQTPPAPVSLGRSRASTPTQPPATPSASGGGGDVEMSCSKPELSWEPSTDLWTSSVDDTRASSIQPGSAGSGEEVSVHGTPTSGGGGRSPETCTPEREQPTAVAHWPNAIAQAFSEAAALAAAQQRRSPTPTPAPTQLLSRESSPAAPERVTSPSTPPPSATRMSTPVSTPRPQLLPAVPPRSAPPAPAAASASVRARRSRPATLAPAPLPPPPSSPTPSPREFSLSAPVGPRGSRAAAVESSAAARGEWWAAPAALGARRRSATAVAYLASQRPAFEPGASVDEAEREGAAKVEAALPSQLAHVAGRARGRGRSRARSHAPDAECALAAEPDHCPKPQAPRGAALGEGDRAGPGAGMGSPVSPRPAPPPTAPRGFSPRCRRPQSALLFLESAPKEPTEERRAASVPDYAPPQPPTPAALWRQSGGVAARHARSSTPSRPPPPPPGPDDAAWKARKKVDATREGKAATDDLERRVLGVRSPPALPPPALLVPLQAPPPTRRLPLLPSLDGTTGSTRRCRSLHSRERLLAPHGPAAAELSLAARPCTAPGRGTGPRTDAASAPARPRFPWRGALAPRHDDAPNAHPAPRTPPRAPRACPCPVLASAPLSSYDAFIREHLIAPPTPPARATGSHVCGGKAARGDGAKWVCHCSASFDRRSPVPFALGAAAWDEGEKSGTAPFGAGPLRKEQRSQEAEVSPCRDSDLQACAPPTRPGSGDGSGAGRGSSPDPGQRLRLSPFRQIAELPKIVEFAEDSSLESTSVDSGHTHSQDASDQGKPLIIRYRKIESSTKSSPPHSSVVFHFNGSPLEAEDRNLTPGTLSIISSDSKTGDGNDSRGAQPQKYVVPYIQEVKMIMENLESMLESRVRNDVALITSKSTSSQTGPEMLVECRSRLESSARRQERRPESPEYEAEETGETRRDASDTSLDNTMGTSEYGSLSSQSKRGVSVKHSLSSLTGKARTAKRCGPPRCPIGEKVIVPCLAHNRIKRSRSGSYIHDDHFALKMLVPEFHVVHTNCSCQKNRDKLS